MRQPLAGFSLARIGLFSLFLGLLAPAQDARAQCSTSDWSSVTGNVSALGSDTTPVGRKYEMDCGLTVDAAQAPAYVTSSAPDQETLVITRFYLYADELDLDGTDAVVFRARGSGNTQLTLAVRELGGGHGIVTSYRSGNTLIEHETVTALLPVWHAITVGWSAASPNGSLYLKIDDRQQFQLTDLDNAGETIQNFDFGLVNNVSGSGSIVVDAFEARRANPEPGLLATNELFSISTRSYVGLGINAAVAGFIVSGDTRKCVLIRGRGPSLPPDAVNVPLLQDPMLVLRSAVDGVFIDSNDNWQDHENADLIAASGRAPGDTADAGIYICLDPGLYTADLTSANGQGLGVGIVEVLDLDEGTPFLFSISTRSEVRNGDERSIAGFIVDGDIDRQVLIRGRGQSIPINDPRVSDPSIRLMSGATMLASNDDWIDADNAGDIAATGRAPEDDSDAAILTTLPPGAYTVIMQSDTGEPGIGIVEVLDISGGSIGAD